MTELLIRDSLSLSSAGANAVTICAVWHNRGSAEMWAGADTRISRGPEIVTTEHGPKLFPLGIKTFSSYAPGKWKFEARGELGFCYAGTTVSAMSTLALASHAAGNLAALEKATPFPKASAIAEIVRSAGDHVMRDMVGRLHVGDNRHQYDFRAMVFGHCRATDSFRIFGLAAGATQHGAGMAMSEMALDGRSVYAIGSGDDRFMELVHEQRGADGTGPIEPSVIFSKMLMEGDPLVGGHFQTGRATKSGFSLMPLFAPGQGHMDSHLMGVPIAALAPAGYAVGGEAVLHDPLRFK